MEDKIEEGSLKVVVRNKIIKKLKYMENSNVNYRLTSEKKPNRQGTVYETLTGYSSRVVKGRES